MLIETTGAEIDLPIDFETQKVKEIPDSVLESLDISSNWWSSAFNSYRFTEFVLYENDQVYIMGHAADNPFVEEGTTGRNEADIMIQQKEGEFFYISNKSENEVLSRKNSDFIGSLIIGCILIIGGLLIIFAKLNIL